MDARISTKRSMYRHLAAGHFGNYMPCWLTLEEAEQQDLETIGARSYDVGDPIRLYRLPRATMRQELSKRGALGRDLIFYTTDYGLEAWRVIQGELMRDSGGLQLRYTFRAEPMRVALEMDERHASGLTALMLLRQHVDPQGVDALMELLDEYDGAVVEFTSYRAPVGAFRHRTIIWEVRHY